MPIALTVNGVTYNYPKLGDENWGQDATNWAVGITQLVNSIDTLITNTLLTGIYEFANGSAFTPTLRFQNSLSTGIYRVSADSLGFTAAGVAAGQISSSGLLRWKDGSAAAPAYSFVADSDIGMYRIGANQLGFATNGTLAFKLDAAQAATFYGDLTVQGTTTLNSVVFQAVDKNLTLNLNGTDASAEGGGLTVARNPSTAGSIVFDSTLPSLWKAGLVGSEHELINVDSIQTLSNKTLASPQLTGTAICNNVTVNGNTIIGSDATDTLTINADLISNILPDATSTYDFGSSAKRWRDLFGARYAYLNTIYAADGAVGSPSHSFETDPDTGLFRSGINEWSLSAGSTLDLVGGTTSVQARLPLGHVDGTLALPGFFFNSDSNTGIYRVAADTLGIVTNGIQALRLDGSQNATFASSVTATTSVVLGPSGATLGALQSATINDNQVAAAVIFTFVAADNEAIVVHFSVARGTTRETGTMHIVNNGTTSDLEVSGRPIGEPGLIFSTDISGGNVRLLYTSTSTGTAGTMKYFTIRWDN